MQTLNYLRPAIIALLALAAGILAAAHAQTPLLALDMPNLSTSPLSSSAVGGVCVMPWVADGDETSGPEDYWGLDPTGSYAVPLIYTGTAGTLGALALYGPGSVDYRDAIITPCAGGDRGACDQPDPLVWVGETLDCSSMTGNIGALTHYALEERYGEGTDCDALTYDEALTLAGTELCQDRAVFIAIIDAFPTGSSGFMEVLGIETFYIAGWDRYPPYGNEDINGDTVPDDAMLWGYFLFDQPPPGPTPTPGPPSIGGIVELRTDTDPQSDQPASSAPLPIGASVALGVLVLGAGGLYASKRWLS